MIPPVAAILYRHDGRSIGDIVSRGSTCDVWGKDVTYLGAAPNGEAYFWVGPGEARWLDERLLWQAGYVMVDYRVVQIGRLDAQYEATRERNSG